MRIVPALLRFTGAVERAPAIATWFATQPSELRSIAQTWFARMRRCGADVRELMHDGFPTACVDDAPFAYVGVFKDHVNVGFFHGTTLSDPSGLLEGTGKYMRHVKLKPGRAVNESALEALNYRRLSRYRHKIVGSNELIDRAALATRVLVVRWWHELSATTMAISFDSAANTCAIGRGVGPSSRVQIGISRRRPNER